MKTIEGMRIQRVHKFPKWMKQGYGVNGGGEQVYRYKKVGGIEREIFCSWRGINGTIATPGYFCVTGEPTYPNTNRFDMTQEWYRIHKHDY